MKRILIAGALALAAGGQALAADLPPPPAPPPRAPATYVPAPVPYYNWSGIYIGANGGYGFGTSSWSGPGLTTGNFNTTGFLAGGTIGGNLQFGPVVVGAEGDWDWSNLSGNTSTTTPTAGGCAPSNCQTSADWLATGRGRIGYAFDRVLFYGTGGAAFAPVKAGMGTTAGSQSSTEVGWTAGAGLEFAFAPNWTAKVEYLYVDLGNLSCTTSCFGAPAAPVATSVKFTENVVRAGINFKFGPWW